MNMNPAKPYRRRLTSMLMALTSTTPMALTSTTLMALTSTTLMALTSTTLMALATLLPSSGMATTHQSDRETLSLDLQRAAFREVYPSAARGDWTPVVEKSPLLQSYILWPDLRGAYLRASIDRVDASEIRSFLSRYGALKPGRELRYRYALQLAKDGQNSAFLELYRQYYQDQGSARLDCLALQAEINNNRKANIMPRAEPLWLVGRSQVKECDPLFDHLRTSGQLGEDQYKKRYDIAIGARNFALARYLAKSLDSRYQHQADEWNRAHRRPESFLQEPPQQGNSAIQREQLIYALGRLSYRQPASAATWWPVLNSNYSFDAQQQAYITRRIALWAARRQNELAPALLSGLSAGAVDTEVRRWRVRSSLRQQSWQQVITGIEAMPKAERSTEVWRYWLAVAQIRDGANPAAQSTLRALAKKRSYYGFLAADTLGLDYAYSNSQLDRDPALLAILADNKLLQRAHELYLVGQDGRGRSEWQAALHQLNSAEKEQAAILAHDWGWHSRAISTVASSGRFNDLDIRYPLPYRANFEKHASAARIDDSWAYGIARSESLFMRDIRSSAGAVGLMQLMPATGRSTAKSINAPYAGLSTLTDPNSNIRLGTAYLGQMYKRFGDNRVLATAAYNAGPRNVSNWLPDNGDIDARVWVENIPFNETRKYVRRVFAADAIFHWRMTGKQKRISNDLRPILALNKDTRLARRDPG
jgi:soluble lytic murein transglycosylase